MTGENGLLSKAQEAENKTEQAEKEEKETLGDMEDIINEYTTGITVEQVTDTNPGELEGNGIETDPYVINSIEDLVFFAYDVTNGNTYEGKYVGLGLSLDFNSNKSYVDALRTDYVQYGYDGELKKLLTSEEGFKPIGTTATKSDNTVKEGNFAGIFDGNNFVIFNSYMNKDVTQLDESYGMALFGRYLYGKIKNLGLVNLNYKLTNSDKVCYISGLTITSMENSEIDNCYVTGSIKQLSYGKGDINCSGIVTYNKGITKSCYNLAVITGEVNDNTLSAGCYIGGIAVNLDGNNSGISNCYNKGNLIAKGLGGIFELGGITRTISGKDAIIENSFNAGNFTVEVQKCGDNITVGRNYSKSTRKHNNK